MATNANGQKGLSANLLPQFYQTTANKKFLQSTVDQLFQPGTLTKVNGYIGRENAKASTGSDVYISSADSNRQNYQLEPGITVRDKLGNVTFFKDYQDYINQINVFGGNTTNHGRLNSQEFYSWDPHIDWDKFVNFQNYYWLPYGPDTITIYGSQEIKTTVYSLSIQSEGANNQYVFTPDGNTPDPVLKLFRGLTYTFNINSAGNPFSFKTSRSLGTTDRYKYLDSIDNYGVENGTITFTVPQNAPNILFYQSETDINLGGVIQILGINDNTSIDVEHAILGKSSVTLPSGLQLSNGMKLSFGGNVTPASYATGAYYVEGVGSAIKLVPESVLEVISIYTNSQSVPFDSTPFDKEPWENADGYAGSLDYITINRASKDHNHWSRYNRWFHQDVITASASYNNNTVSLDQNARATRPIIEFEADLKLFNFGTTAIMDIDILDDATGNTLLNKNAIPVFTAVEGSSGYNEPTADPLVSIPLSAGMLVLFSGDPDPLVQNKIYRVEYVDVRHLNSGSQQLHLVEVASPLLNQVVLVRQGKYQGKMFWFNGVTWVQAQQKNSVNQPPLFDVTDDLGNSFSDLTVYSGSTFAGTKLFSYKLGTGTADSVIGQALSYQNVNNIGDIVFNFNLATDYFEYKDISKGIVNQPIDTGFLSKLNYAGNTVFVNGWQTCKTDTVQAAIKIYKNSGKLNNFDIDIFDDPTKLTDLKIKIYVNGTRLSANQWRIINKTPYKQVVLTNAISSSDVLTIRAFAAQPINSNGYYEIPINLQNNSLNDNMVDFTLGEVIDHVGSIIDNISTFVDPFPGRSKLRDLGNVTQYGTKFVQHSGPLSLGIYHTSAETNNVIKALETARDDYNSFKRIFIQTATNLGKDGDPISIVNLILQKINASKPNVAPYYFSDMVPYGACGVTDLTVVDHRIKKYPLSSVFTLDDLTTFNANKAVGVYLNGNQLVHGRDYIFDNQGFFIVDNSVNLVNGNTLSTYEYDSTDGCFVPATPTKLGMWPAYIPQIYVDTTLVNAQTVIQGHDGSIMLAYGDYRDALILELEKRIFNNIKVKYDATIFDINDIVPSYNRTTQYNKTEFNEILAPNFYKWSNLVGKDLTTPLNYDRTDSFTYNYSYNTAPNGTQLPGYWRGIYRWLLDTDRPNLCPWEMLGFSIAPAWWVSVYGPAPYTSDNLPMWQDISLGIVREPNKPVVYNTRYAKPFILDHLPVDQSGNLLSPQNSGLAGGTIRPSIDNNFVFGDGSPVEGAWLRSSFYSFSVIITAILLNPAKSFGVLLDRSRIIRNIAGQLIYKDTGLRIRPKDIILPSVYSSKTRTATAGLVNYIVDLIFNYIFSNNVVGYESYLNDLKTMQLQLSYRVGAFTNKDQFNLLLESKTPSSTGNVFVPAEDYTVFLNKSSSVKKLVYSGVIITRLSTGFEVKGYSISQPFFKYYAPSNIGGNVNVGGISENYVQWSSDQIYVSGTVVQYGNAFYRVAVTHTSSNSFELNYFAQLTGLPMVGGANAAFATRWNTTEELVAPYGTLFSTIQQVVNFLLGYGEYLKKQGFLFDDFNNNLNHVANWETSAREFMFWTTQNWSAGQDQWSDWKPNQPYSYAVIVRYEGDYYSSLTDIAPASVFNPDQWSILPGLSNVGSSVISLSPSANGVNFKTTLSVVDSITSKFNPYEIFKVNGTPFETHRIHSYRQENTVTYNPKTTDGIYGASFYLIQNEHVIIINNSTIFNDVIYNPASGYRRERLKVSGYITINWYGGLDIPGFIFDSATINLWQPYQDYNSSDIISYQNYYYSANKFIPGSDVFVAKQWTQLKSKPSSQIYPNWTNIATQFTDFYGLEVDSFDGNQQKVAQHLIGYQKRQYLENIIQDDVSEYKFYQGMIREKGTLNVLNKLFDVLSSDKKESLTFYEEWALRVGQYGAANAFDDTEFILDRSAYSKNNPQATVVVNSFDKSINPFIVQQISKDIYIKPLGVTTKVFPVVDNFKSYLRSAGYVNSSDVLVGIGPLSQLVSQTATSIDVGVDYVILSVGTTDFTQIGASANTVGLSFKSTTKGIGTGTVTLDITKVTEGSYVWTSFDDSSEVNSWNVYRFTDIGVRVNSLKEANGILTIGCKSLVKFKTGDYVGIVFEDNQIYPGLNGFFEVKSVTLNTFTVSAPSTLVLPAPFVNPENLVVFGLVSQRAPSIDSIDSIIPATLATGDLIWTDDAGNGSWATWRYQPVYKQTTLYNTVLQPSLQFGHAISASQAGTVVAVGMLSGQISIYDKVNKTINWTQRQYIQAPFVSNYADPTTLATTTAISIDGTWLASGSPQCGYAASRYLGNYDSNHVYAVGDIVSSSGMYYQAVLPTPANNTPVTTSYYWSLISYIPVDALANNSSLATQGAITIYQKDINNVYKPIDTILSPYPVAHENFGSALIFDNNNDLYISAIGSNNFTGRVYKLAYKPVLFASTYYDEVDSFGTVMHVTSTAGVMSGQTVQGTGLSKGQTVVGVYAKLSFDSIPGFSNCIRDTENNNILLSTIIPGTVVTGAGILDTTIVVKSGIDLNGNNYILVRAPRDIVPTVSLIRFINSNLDFYTHTTAATSQSTVVLSDTPDSTVSGMIDFVKTSWQYVLDETLSGASAGENFGSYLSINDEGNTLLISSQGSVGIYKNNGTTLELAHTLVGNDQSFGNTTTISKTGQFIAVTDNLSVEATVTKHGAVSIYEYDTNVNSYTKIQSIVDHFDDAGSNFGKKIAFMNDYNTLVVYSDNASAPIHTTFDVYANLLADSSSLYGTLLVNDPNSGPSLETTTFDKNSTTFKTIDVGSGRIDVYDRYNINWVFSETIANPDQTQDGFGFGFAVGNNNIFVGAPLATEKSIPNAGTVYVYNKPNTLLSWTQYRTQSPVADISKIKKAFLYNRYTSELVTHLDIIDPIQGKIPGPAEEEISYKTFYDPAIYSYSDGTATVNANSGEFWSNNQLGQLWWDLRTTKFVTPYFSDVAYKNNVWNTLAPGASVDVYEWISTNLLPSQWDSQADTVAGLALGISGTSLYGNSAYTVRQRYNNITQKFVNTYYYWVKNKIIVPAVGGRHISAQSVAMLIASPKNQSYTYLAFLGQDTFSLANVSAYLSDSNVVLAVENWTTDTIHRNIHSQWKLISTDTIVEIPKPIEEKWIDSLCGVDISGRSVPDINLPPKLKYGVENRPRQGMFVNRVEALKELVEATNIALAQDQIVKNYNLTALESYDKEPGVLTALYDSVVDTTAELNYVNVNSFQRPLVAPVMVDGRITRIQIINSGKGYLVAPYIVIVGSGKNAIVKSTIDNLGRIVGATVVEPGYGYDSNTVCTIRDYSILVHTDEQANGSWSIFSYDPTYVDRNTGLTVGLHSRILTQRYDVRNYWNYIDWYGSYTDTSGKVLFTANHFTAADFLVQTYSDLNSIHPTVGQVVKVKTVNSGGWELLYKYAESNSIDWTQSYSVVGIENGTIQLSSTLYETKLSAVGYDASIYDSSGFDVKASNELRIILNSLKNDIFVNDLKGTYLDLFFRSVHYAHSEQLYLDWIFKTSFVRATHNVGTLGQPVYYPVDNLNNFQDYVNEVKPYRTTVREYISNYTALDVDQSAVSDFDLPPIYANNALTVINSKVQNNLITVDSPQVTKYPWKFWADNNGYQIIELRIINGGSGYVAKPTVVITSDSGTSATADAYYTNGVINRLILTNPGSGYLSAPTINFIGGLDRNGIPAKAVAIIGDGLVRSSLTKIKFDRISRQNYIISLSVTETLLGSGSRIQFPLTWAPDITIGQSSVFINNVSILRELYTLHVVSTTVNGYTQYSGKITFVSAPPSNSTITVNYKKDVSLLEAVDRIEFYYNPTTGQLGKDLKQLMTGVDYGGTSVGNLGFNTSQGWGRLPWASENWDVFDPAFNDYIITVAANTYSFTLPYSPKTATELNVYYVSNSTTSSPTNPTQTIYPYNLYAGLVTVSVTTDVYTVSLLPVTTTTIVPTPLKNPYAVSYTVQSLLHASYGAAGQAILTFNSVSNIIVGQYVSGNGVILDTTVIDFTDTTVTLSSNLTSDAVGSYSFFSLGTTLTLASTQHIAAGMSIVGAQFDNQTVTKVLNATTIYISRSPNGIVTAGETIKFTDNAAGSTLLHLTSVSNLKVGDVVSTSDSGIFGYNTEITAIDTVNSEVTLSQILYKSILDNVRVTFTRILKQPTEVQVFANGTAVLTSPLPSGSVVNVYGQLDPVRLDAEDFDTNTQMSITNPYAVMPSIVIGTTGLPYLTVDSYLDGSKTYTINVPHSFPVLDGDEFIIRQSTSDGAIAPAVYDTDLSGGDLAYTTANGISADDLILDGDDFVSPTSSSAPEEVVPGQVVDTLAIKVFDRIDQGSANIKVTNFKADGSTVAFPLTEFPSSLRAVIVKVDGQIKNITSDYSVDYQNQEIMFNSAPANNSIVTIGIFGYAGTNVLDLDYFVSDGVTNEFITKAPWLGMVTSSVFVNGLPAIYTLFKTDSTYELANAIGIRFVSAPAAGTLINYIIVKGSDQTFAITNTETIATDGSSSYTLQYPIGLMLPDEPNMIVRVDQTILQGPTSVYFAIGSNRLNYSIDADRVQPFSIAPQDVVVSISGNILVQGRDYQLDLGGVTVKINKNIYKSYTGKTLTVTVNTSSGYSYNPATKQITFSTAYDSSHVVEVISAYTHDSLDTQRTDITIESVGDLDPTSVEYLSYSANIGGFIALDRTVINENYIWVTQNSILLTPGVDFVLNDDRASIQLTKYPNINDTVTLITFGSNVLKPSIAYMQFKDMLNRTSYTRLNANKRTILSQDLHWNDISIVVENADILDTPNPDNNYPGVIEIRGERIEYFAKNGNVLSRLRRGILGTGVGNLYKAGSFVQNIGRTETIPYQDSASTSTVVSNGTTNVSLNFVPGGFDTTWTYKGSAMSAADAISLAKSAIEVFVGGYDTSLTWQPNINYTAGTIVNQGSYTYRAKIDHTSGITFSGDSDRWAFFVGNIRLRKDPFKVFNINNAPDSPAGNVLFPADFTVDGVHSSISLAQPLAIGTFIKVIQTTGIDWDGKTNILDDNSKISQFIKAAPGIWYSEYKN